MTEKKIFCTRCILDSSVPGITFNSNGECNFCTEFLELSGHIIHKSHEQQQRELQEFVKKVKRNGSGKKYDCIVGVSGGIDSSWALVQAVNLGLRPLAVHMDNGWNSELAQNNIENLVRGLNVDLYTHVIDWDEYRNLMQAFFEADVIDIELLYDNAMLAVIYKLAADHGLRYILTGYNKATEGIQLPESWTWNKFDKRNIVALGKRFGKVKLKTFPALGTWNWAWYHYIKLIQLNPFLDFFPYNKFHALDVLQKEYAYKPYPYKHYESIFTRFYQGFILPQKFNVDKRKIHLATLVVSGQMTRDAALEMLKQIPYPSLQDLESDKLYFLKKMGWTMAELNAYLARPEVRHDAYPSERKLFKNVASLPERIPRPVKNFVTNTIKAIR